MKVTRKHLFDLIREGWQVLRLPLVAVIFGLLVGALAMMWVGAQEGLSFSGILYKPIAGYLALFTSVFGSFYGFGEAVVYAIPLILTGLSIAFAFRCGLFNIGAEGQFVVGLLAAAYVGFTFNTLPALLQLILAIIAAAIAGGLWAGFAGWLKAKRGVHEVITTIMLNYIALYLYNYFVASPNWFKSDNFSGSHAINPAIRLPRIELFSPSRAHVGIYIALAVAVIIYLVLWRTRTGFEVRAVGLNANAAHYAGINVAQKFVVAMLISGMLAGLAGGLHLLGTMRRATQFGASPGYGFDGIAISLIGGNHPAGVVLSAFLFAFLKRGAPLMQSQAGIAQEIVLIVQAFIIFFVAADKIVKWFFLLSKKQKGEMVHD